MKKKILVIISLIILLFILYLLFIRNNSIKKGLENIEDINEIIEIDIDDIDGSLLTTHTTNMVHAANKEIKNEYSFKLNNSKNNIDIYLDNKKTSISKDNLYNLYDVDDVDKCNKDNKDNKYIYKCDNYQIEIYYSKIFKKYIKSIIKDDMFTYTYQDNYLEISNDEITYKYNIISDNNYKLEINYMNNDINIYYSNSSYSKYSISYKDNNFNIIEKDDEIIISIPCELDKYNNLEININNNTPNNDEDNKYEEVSLDDMLKTILSEEIYNMFN